MRKTIATTIFTAIAAMVFAEEPTQLIPFSTNEITTDNKISAHEKVSDAGKSFVYLRMGATDTYPTNSLNIVPGLGIGYRLHAGVGAIDLSANYTEGRMNTESKTYFYTLPKASYLHYLSPAKAQSLYAGAGLAFGGLKNKEGTEFLGLIPNATVGYEMNRTAAFRSFVQLDVSQPALASELNKAEGKGFPGPIAEMSVGVGF